jgi:hypothetical protein
MEAAGCSDCSNQLSDDTRATFQIMGQIRRLKNNSDNGGSICVGNVTLKLHTQKHTEEWRLKRGEKKRKTMLWKPGNIHVRILVGFGQQNFFFKFLQFDEIMCYY